MTFVPFAHFRGYINFQLAIREAIVPDETKILIYVVDDDASVRKSLTMLFMSADMEVQTFEAAEDFLKGQFREKKACLISDIKLKGLNGLELKQKLAERGIEIPVIFLTAFDSNEIRQQAKQAGAVGFFENRLMIRPFWIPSNGP